LQTKAQGCGSRKGFFFNMPIKLFDSTLIRLENNFARHGSRRFESVAGEVFNTRKSYIQTNIKESRNVARRDLPILDKLEKSSIVCATSP